MLGRRKSKLCIPYAANIGFKAVKRSIFWPKYSLLNLYGVAHCRILKIQIISEELTVTSSAFLSKRLTKERSQFSYTAKYFISRASPILAEDSFTPSARWDQTVTQIFTSRLRCLGITLYDIRSCFILCSKWAQCH